MHARSCRRGYRITQIVLLVAACGPTGRPAGAGEQTIDLRGPVFQVLSARCWDCHDSVQRAGGLDLESLAGLKAGGFSGQSPLAAPWNENELGRRVSAADPAYRMPKGRPPLEAGEQQVLRDWLAQGAPWPDEQIERSRHLGEFFSRHICRALGPDPLGPDQRDTRRQSYAGRVVGNRDRYAAGRQAATWRGPAAPGGMASSVCRLAAVA